MAIPTFAMTSSPSHKRSAIIAFGAPSASSSSSGPLNKRLRLDVALSLPEDISPTEYAAHVLKSQGVDSDAIGLRMKAAHFQPTPEMIAAYTKEASRAVRDNDLEKLKELHQADVLLECCNRFGNSLLHLAARRGLTQIVAFLVDEVGVSVRMLDDLRRCALHDALWTSKPNFGIVDVLLRKAPEFIFLADDRGHLPFDYCRREHWGAWVEFLSQRQELLRPKREDTSAEQ